MTINAITTGEQAVNSTGAVTGVLNTSTLATDFTLKVRVRGLATGDTMSLAFEDTANSSEFSDAIAVALINITGGGTADPQAYEGNVYSFRSYEVPTMRYGATHNELRVNCYAISGGTAQVLAWMEV